MSKTTDLLNATKSAKPNTSDHLKNAVTLLGLEGLKQGTSLTDVKDSDKEDASKAFERYWSQQQEINRRKREAPISQETIFVEELISDKNGVIIGVLLSTGEALTYDGLIGYLSDHDSMKGKIFIKEYKPEVAKSSESPVNGSVSSVESSYIEGKAVDECSISLCYANFLNELKGKYFLRLNTSLDKIVQKFPFVVIKGSLSVDLEDVRI